MPTPTTPGPPWTPSTGPSAPRSIVRSGIAGLKQAFGFGRVGGRIPVDHPEPFERAKRRDQLDQPPQGAVHRPDPLDWRHFAVANAQDRLDTQERARPAPRRGRCVRRAAGTRACRRRARCAAGRAPPRAFRRSPGARAPAAPGWRPSPPASPGKSTPSGNRPRRCVAGRPIRRPCCATANVPLRLRGQIDADDRVVLLELFAEGSLEGRQAGRTRLRQRLAGPQARVEVGGAQVQLVAERLAIPVDDQRHHAQAEALLQRGLQVGGAIGNDANRRSHQLTRARQRTDSAAGRHPRPPPPGRDGPPRIRAATVCASVSDAPAPK